MNAIRYESVAQRARRLGHTVSNEYQALRAGRIPGAVKVGREWRIPVPSAQPSEPVRDWKSAAAGDME